MGCLRTELQQARDDRDRQLSQVHTLTDEIGKYKDFTGRSVSELDCLSMKSDELEVYNTNSLEVWLLYKMHPLLRVLTLLHYCFLAGQVFNSE